MLTTADSATTCRVELYTNPTLFLAKTQTTHLAIFSSAFVDGNEFIGVVPVGCCLSAGVETFRLC